MEIVRGVFDVFAENAGFLRAALCPTREAFDIILVRRERKQSAI